MNMDRKRRGEHEWGKARGGVKDLLEHGEKTRRKHFRQKEVVGGKGRKIEGKKSEWMRSEFEFRDVSEKKRRRKGGQKVV